MTEPSQKIAPFYTIPKFLFSMRLFLIEKHIEEENCKRLICSKCDSIHYINPKLVAGAIPYKDGKILLLRRGLEPLKGLWTYPAGYVEILWRSRSSRGSWNKEKKLNWNHNKWTGRDLFLYKFGSCCGCLLRLRSMEERPELRGKRLKLKHFRPAIFLGMTGVPKVQETP